MTAASLKRQGRERRSHRYARRLRPFHDAAGIRQAAHGLSQSLAESAPGRRRAGPSFDIRYRKSILSMHAKAAELLHGTLNLLFLRTLELRPLHGVGMADRIEQVTHGVFVVGPGFLFPAQHRLAEEGWITGKWREVENGRRAKFYDLTTAGRAQRPRICLTLRWLRTKTAHKLLGLSQVSECTEAEEAWRWRTA
jgi:PadR family transcriptional regulator